MMGGNQMMGEPDDSEFDDESDHSNQMMGGADGSEFDDESDHSNQMMGGGGGPEFAAIECDATNVCDRPDGDVGIWVCRSMTHPVTGDALSRAICIPNNHAWTTGTLKVNLIWSIDLSHFLTLYRLPSDECGCCMDETGADLECPVLPDLITLQCANNTQPDMPYGMAGLHGNWQHNASHGNWQHNASLGSWQHNASLGSWQHDGSNLTDMMDSFDRQFVCRELMNPFTGESQPKTLFIPQDRAIDGDICGCCNGNCSFSAEDDVYVTTQQAATNAAGSSGTFACSFGTLTTSILIAVGMGMFW
jgi:hypothetical protein